MSHDPIITSHDSLQDFSLPFMCFQFVLPTFFSECSLFLAHAGHMRKLHWRRNLKLVAVVLTAAVCVTLREAVLVPRYTGALQEPSSTSTDSQRPPNDAAAKLPHTPWPSTTAAQGSWSPFHNVYRSLYHEMIIAKTRPPKFVVFRGDTTGWGNRMRAQVCICVAVPLHLHVRIRLCVCLCKRLDPHGHPGARDLTVVWGCNQGGTPGLTRNLGGDPASAAATGS